MKMYINLLALCVFHSNVWDTSAFFVQAPKVRTTKVALKNSNVSETAAASAGNGMASWLTSSTGAPATPAGGVAQVAGASGVKNANNAQTTKLKLATNIWDTSIPELVQGGSLRTWSESTGEVERVQVLLKTEGRPLNANVELWHGPDNTPLKMKVYSEDGGLRPFAAVVETPRGGNTIAIRNTGQMEFPLACIVEADVEDTVLGYGAGAVGQRLSDRSDLKTMQGGAIMTFPFDLSVSSVQVLLKTGGRPMHARIELLQGPNNDKQVVEIYTEDGLERPFYAVIETPGTGNVVRVVNTATVEFPLTISVQPYVIEADGDKNEVSRGWDNGGSSVSLPW
jgi:hypothetical protein